VIRRLPAADVTRPNEVESIFVLMPKAWLGVTLGRESTGFMKSHAWIFIAGARVLFVSLYAFVLWRNRGRVE
jgi:hypothetical protein